MRIGLGLRRSRGDLFLKRIDPKGVPAHVAIIMDGNGRWAARRGLPRLAGHRASAKAIREAVETATEVGVRYLTIYTFSVENWRRPRSEVEGLMALFEEQLAKEIDQLDREGVRIRVIGRLDELPDSTKRAFEAAAERTSGNSRLDLIVALNYGGRTEIVDAAAKLAAARVEEALSAEVSSGEVAFAKAPLSEADFAGALYAPDVPDPELLIRTSGELRLSNFLLWQIAYAELWVTPVLWPEFGRTEFLQAVYEFQQRRRRFGGLKEEDI